MKPLLPMVLAACLPAAALAKSPAPDFLVESRFQRIMAEHIAAVCPEFERGHPAIRRHQMAETGKISDLGVHARNIRDHFAPIPLGRYERHFAEFFTRHGLSPNSPDGAYCAAGRRENMRRTMIGLMLKPVPGENAEGD